MRRWIGRAGWFLAIGTIVTAASLVPSILERPDVMWMDWLGVIGSLVFFVMIRFGFPSTSLLTAVVAFIANMASVALLLGVAVHLLGKLRRRGPAQA